MNNDNIIEQKEESRKQIKLKNKKLFKIAKFDSSN